MALRFALLRDYQRGAPASFRTRSQLEVFFIDLDTEEELVMLVRDRFRGSPPAARDSPWICHQTSVYMCYLAYIRRAIVPDVHGIIGKRVPTPLVASLLYMMHLIRRFGFTGDDALLLSAPKTIF
ncbi:hypothetical protein C8F04DRAFT_1274610 [Mycena alexandri]|uniref:Uncharacterized protein n=1 Tax=Mycena alexandri TaxID=1745969 RepID=A0AAD6S5R9_9AGAR|nr:hypothetical protein C8F04DRAFT_1274610 [Mycena alexandri]